MEQIKRTDKLMLVNDIMAESARQQDMYGEFWERFSARNSTHPRESNRTALAVLAEEFGEIAMAVNDSNKESLYEELIQTAAVCLTWLNGMKGLEE